MTSLVKTENNVINVYAAGGAAMNIVSEMLSSHAAQLNSNKTNVLAELNVTLVDTSTSNYAKHGHVFREHGAALVTIDGLDGSGQVRQANVKNMLPYIGKIVKDNGVQDAALNIVIHSCSGGTGSSAGVLMVKEMLASGKNVIVLMVGDDTTKLYTTNTAATVKSYFAISNQLVLPVVAHYFQNNGQRIQKETINTRISNMVMEYRLLFGGHIHGVDSSDLTNFLNYPKVTQVRPNLVFVDNVSVEVNASTDVLENYIQELNKDAFAISMVSVQIKEDDVIQKIHTDYRVDGSVDYSPSQNPDVVLNNLHFVTVDNVFHGILQNLENTIKDYETQSSVRIQHSIVVEGDDESGLVF